MNRKPRWTGRRRSAAAGSRGRPAPTGTGSRATPVTSSTVTTVVGVPAQPGRGRAPERGAGDDAEVLLAEPGDGQVGLDPGALVEQLGVDGACPTGRSTSLAHTGCRAAAAPGPATSSLANEDWSKSAGRVAGRRRTRPRSPATRCARPSRRARSAASPARGVDAEPVDPLPARLLAELGVQLDAAAARRADRRSGRPAVHSCPGRRCRSSASRRRAPRASPRSGWRRARRSGGCPSCATSYSGWPSTIHSAITLPTPPAAASPCTQKPGRDPEAGDPAVSPRMNSPSGVNASGPFTTRAISASRSAGHPARAAAHDSSNRSRSGVEERPRLGQRRRRRRPGDRGVRM